VYFPNDPAVEILFSSWGPTHSLWLTETYPELSDTIHIFLTGNKWLLLGRLINRHGALTRGPAQSGEVSVHWKTIEEFQVNKIQEDYEKDHHVIDTTEIIGSKYITIKEVVRKVEEIAGLPSPD
jgi:hypothetical protein